jgi:hypothetical protein
MSALKKHAHWVGLSALTLASLGGTYLLMLAAEELPSSLSKLQPSKPKPKEVGKLDLSSLAVASEKVSSPATWKTDYATLLFVSEHYILEDGQPKRPKEGSIHAHTLTKQPIPNSWFIQNKLSLFSARVPLEDPDGDGFSNEEEWLSKTDPNDQQSHPPLVAKLVFTNLKTQNNRVKFLQYLGNPAKAESLRITVRAEDIPGANQVEVRVGATIPGTSFRVKSFESRRRKNPTGSFYDDASVVFIEDKNSGRVEPAELQQMANFADQTVFLKLSYGSSEKEFSGKPGSKITLEEGDVYEILSVSTTSARLRSAKGLEYEIRAGGASPTSQSTSSGATSPLPPP